MGKEGPKRKPPLKPLSSAELENFRLLAGGMSAGKVAEARGVSINTVNTQIQVACSKMGVNDFPSGVGLAVGYDMIAVPPLASTNARAIGNDLTPAEYETLIALIHGKSKTVAAKRDVGIPTIQAQLAKIRRKLGGISRAKATVLGIQYRKTFERDTRVESVTGETRIVEDCDGTASDKKVLRNPVAVTFVQSGVHTPVEIYCPFAEVPEGEEQIVCTAAALSSMRKPCARETANPILERNRQLAQRINKLSSTQETVVAMIATGLSEAEIIERTTISGMKIYENLSSAVLSVGVDNPLELVVAYLGYSNRPLDDIEAHYDTSQELSALHYKLLSELAKSTVVPDIQSIANFLQTTTDNAQQCLQGLKNLTGKQTQIGLAVYKFFYDKAHPQITTSN